MTGVADIVFSPFVPWWALAALGAVALLLVGFGLWRRFSGLGWRIIAIVALLAALANPAIVEEERDPQNDVAIVVVDDSASQNIGERRAQTDGTLERLRGDLERQRNLETRVVRAGATHRAPSRRPSPLRRPAPPPAWPFPSSPSRAKVAPSLTVVDYTFAPTA